MKDRNEYRIVPTCNGGYSVEILRRIGEKSYKVNDNDSRFATIYAALAYIKNCVSLELND